MGQRLSRKEARSFLKSRYGKNRKSKQPSYNHQKEDNFSDPTWSAILFWYSQSFYTTIENLGYDKAKEIAEAAGRYSLEYPLWMGDKKSKEFKQFTLPYIGEKSGPYLIAIQGAFLVWTQRQLADNPLPDSPILKACEDGLSAWKLGKRGDN